MGAERESGRMSTTTYAASNSMLPELTFLDLGGESIEVESLCRGVLKRLAPGVSPPLEPCEHDDALAFLLGEIFVQASLYDATRAGIRPRPWLFDRIGLRLIDEWRRVFGRNGQRRPALSATGAHHRGGMNVESGLRLDLRDPRMDRLEQATATLSSDRSTDWPDDLERLYARGDRETLREERRLGLDTPRRAPSSSDRAGARALVRVERRAPSKDRVAAPWRDCRCGWRVYAQAPNGYPGWHYPECCPACGCGLA